MPIRVEVLRGGTLESEHAVDGVVVDAVGRVLAATERPDRVTFWRSSAKPFQALPFVERGHFDALGLGERHMALMCASHNGEPEHVAAAREILDSVGATPADLECGFQMPDYPDAAERVRQADPAERTALYHNCSGKHAAFVALCTREGWPVAGYTHPDHPLQRLMRRTMAEACGVDDATTPYAVDGCSASNPALPLLAMARAYAAFAAARPGGATPRERAMARIRTAMVNEPFMVAGTRRFCTDFMRATGGRLVTKTGAEGLQCIGVPERGLGIVLKALDGARRASGPATLGWLAALDLLTPAEVRALAEHASPPVLNHRDVVVGALAAGSFPAWRAADPAASAVLEGAPRQ